MTMKVLVAAGLMWAASGCFSTSETVDREVTEQAGGHPSDVDSIKVADLPVDGDIERVEADSLPLPPDSLEASPEPALPEEAPAVVPISDRSVKERANGFLVTGYYPWWMRSSWQHLDLPLYDRIMYFTLHGGADGSIHAPFDWPDGHADLFDHLRREQVGVVPTIAVLQADTVKALFADPTARNRFLQESIRVFRQSGFSGLHIDVEIFEEVDDTVREGFLDWIDLLAYGMKSIQPDAVLSLFLPAFDNAKMYDLDRLGAVVDLFMVQGYDIHWMEGPRAGPLAPLRGWDGVNWGSIVDRILGHGIDPKKIVMTVPYYGYEWPVASPLPGAATRGRAREMTIEMVDSTLVPRIHDSVAERLAGTVLQRDPDSGSPFYVLRTDDGWVQGWFEDERSLRAKYGFIRERGLGGIAVFPIGYDNGTMDAAIRDVFGDRRP